MNFYNVCILVDFISAIIIYLVFLFPKWSKNAYELFIKSCLYIYGIAVLYYTCIIPIFIPIPYINLDISRVHANLVPFIDYLYSRGDFIRQILLNILMLIPFGIMYPFIYKKSFKDTMIKGVLISICIELIQLLSVRQISSCDITDVINNTLGVSIGYIIYKIFRKPVEKILKKVLNKKIETYRVPQKFKNIVIIVIIVELIIRSIIRNFI